MPGQEMATQFTPLRQRRNNALGPQPRAAEYVSVSKVTERASFWLPLDESSSHAAAQFD